YERIEELAEKRLRNQAGAVDELLETVSYDNQMRQVVKEKTGMSVEMMDFVFGRPLEKTIPAQFGIKIFKNDQIS
ncbi:MAG: hypothetical protein ACLFPI_05805, partial [Desulfobacterales bacterium]